METSFLNLIRGYVRIRIVGNSYDRFLNLCAFHGIRLWNLMPAGEAYEADISGKDFKKLKTIVKKSHAAVSITKRRGLPFFIHRYRKRKLYVAGIAAAFVFMAWLSAHIWNISIEGNVSQTDDVIFEYLENSGIRHGMWKSGVDCKELAAEIRNYFTQFAWVAAEMKGTRLIIYVKEGILSANDAGTGEESSPSSLKAAKSGTVSSIYVRKGMPMVAAGDTVEKGDLLVSGALPIYNDSQEISSWQYVSADADIVIQSNRNYYDELPLTAVQKGYTGRQKESWMIRVGSLPFSFPDSFGEFEQYDLTSEMTQYRLMENFYLPIYVQKFTAKEYENLEIIYTKEQAEQIIQSNFQYFMKNLEEKGVQIFENDVKIEWNEKSAIASGILTTGENAVERVTVEGTEEELLKDEYG